MTENHFSKNKNYSSKIVIIDGLSGCGKILVAELIKAIKNTEVVKLETTFDHIPILFSFKKIEKYAAQSILKTIFDKLIYYNNISREINLRKNDLTFSLNHPKKLNYINSLLNKPNSDEIINKQLSPKQIFPFMVHMSTFNNTLLEETFNNLNIIYILRDPLFILETYSSYLDRVNSDPREFTPKINFDGIEIPWYAKNWENEYLKINNTEKSIVLVEKCLDLLIKKLKSNYNKFNIYKVLFFEDLVKNTDENFFEIEKIFKQGYYKNYLKYIKKKNKIPRSSEAVVEGFWKRYTFKNLSREGDNEEKILKRIKKDVSVDYFNKLLKLRKKYNRIKYEFKNI